MKHNKLFRCISVLMSIISTALAQYPGQFTSCVTPQNEPGFCKKLNKCPHVFGKVSIKKLQELISICGREAIVDNFPVVCCVNLDPRYTMCRSRDSYWKLGSCKLHEDCNTLMVNKNETELTAFENICSDSSKLCCPHKPPVLLESSDLPLGGANCSCGCVSQNIQRISNGEQSRLGAFPWLARLGYLQNVLSFKCAGSLITHSHVLTAAHCIRTDLLLVRLGEFDTSTDRETTHLDINIWKIYYHEAFENIYNDISLLYLEKSVDFTDLVKPLCLPLTFDTSSRVWEGHVSYVAGWGSEFESRSSNVHILREVELEVYNSSKCHLYENFDKEMMLCAGGLDGKDACKGDSGGPLMVQENNVFYLVGIVSHGVGCGRREYPGVYVRLQHYIEWIRNHTKNLN